AVTLVYALLPLANVGLLPVVIALALMRFSFEYALVSNIILISEQAPAQRGKVMSLAAAMNLTGITISGFSGPWAYEHFGVWGLGPVSAACTALGLTILLRWVHEHGSAHKKPPIH
ncbi:MAG: MFS transporter, partial [Caldilineae bacterium]